MTKSELLKILRDLRTEEDLEKAHVIADSAVLMYLDDQEISDAFADLDKWYA